MKPLITLAELFATQSTLTVDEPEGEYTIGSPANLFDHFKPLQLEVNAKEQPNGTRDIAIRYKDNSEAVISIPSDGPIRIADNYDISPDEPTRPQPQYDHDWGLIGKETPQGLEYHAYANALYTTATQDFQEPRPDELRRPRRINPLDHQDGVRFNRLARNPIWGMD